MSNLQLHVHDAQDICSIDTDSIRPIVDSVLKLESTLCSELNVYFISMEQMCEIHEQFFNDPSPTDCISIQVDPPGQLPCLLGEIFIAPQAAQEALKTYQTSFEEEITLYLVHGLLHLLGYDDIAQEDRDKMRLAEKRHMDYLKEHQLLIKL